MPNPREAAPYMLWIEVDGRSRPVRVRRSGRARRLSLRLDVASGAPVLTLPKRAALAQAERFLGDHSAWLAERLARLPAAAPFADGALFPLRGEPCRIAHRPGRGTIALETGTLETGTLETGGGERRVAVPGEAAHLPRRLTDWLKREARRDLGEAVARHAERLGRRPAAIHVRDTRSRWGSCSASRTLSFSWRLVLAPPFVLDYLAAHETAHLAEMNHGRHFWAQVGVLVPDFKTARAWLKAHGAALHAVGREG